MPPKSLQLTMLATMVRAAASTFKKFPGIRERLHEGLNMYGIQQTLMGAARGALHREGDRGRQVREGLADAGATGRFACTASAGSRWR